MVNLAVDSRIKDEVLEKALYARLKDVRDGLIVANRITVADPSNTAFFGWVQELEAERTCLRRMLGLNPFPLSPFIPRSFPVRRW